MSVARTRRDPSLGPTHPPAKSMSISIRSKPMGCRVGQPKLDASASVGRSGFRIFPAALPRGFGLPIDNCVRPTMRGADDPVPGFPSAPPGRNRSSPAATISIRSANCSAVIVSWPQNRVVCSSLVLRGVNARRGPDDPQHQHPDAEQDAAERDPGPRVIVLVRVRAIPVLGPSCRVLSKSRGSIEMSVIE